MVQKNDVLCYPSFTSLVTRAGFLENQRLLMNYCGECGKPVSKKIPLGDNLPRFVCDSCQVIHYHNPKIVAGCIPEWEEQVLLCRRAIEPKSGLWTFPAGFMEIGEGTEEAARREGHARKGRSRSRRETCARLPRKGAPRPPPVDRPGRLARLQYRGFFRGSKMAGVPANPAAPANPGVGGCKPVRS